MEKNLISEEDLILEFNEICKTEKNIKDLKQILLFEQKFPEKQKKYESIDLRFIHNLLVNYEIKIEWKSKKWFFGYFNNPFSRNPYITFNLTLDQRKLIIKTLNKLNDSIKKEKS